MRRLIAAFLIAASPAWALPPTVSAPSVPLNSPRVPTANAGAANGAAVLDANSNILGAWNALQHGVAGDGTTDDAPAIRALLASNRNIVFPPATYYLARTNETPGFDR